MPKVRVKPVALAGIALAGAVALGAGSQTWISFMLADTHSLETVTGHDVNAALSPVAIALIAAALALAIAGPVFRRILGALVALLGAGTAALAIGVLADPTSALVGRVTEITGLSGGSGSSIVWMEMSMWGYVCAVAGVLAVALGAVVLVTAGRWAAAGRKYDSDTRRVDPAKPDRISDWDALSEGDDPSDDIR
ncbi:MAG: Trp biosynthesis-associated membrane protein [Leucobacter sp.]